MTFIHLAKPSRKRITPLSSHASPAPWTTSWTTRDEIEFLKHLGQHRPEEFTPLSSSLLVHRYQEAMALRADWQKMSQARIARSVEIQMRKEADG